MEDYNKLYHHQWNLSAPNSPWEGMLTNYTSDLLFAMEKISTSPFSLRRLRVNESLPFPVEVGIATNITGQSLDQLQKELRLFYIDYSHHKAQPLQRGRYAASCEAYFYIDSKSSDFLPLAIKTNTEGADLTYTPLDSPSDWLLAKLLFNINDGWHQQWEHFAASHWVSEIVYLAAIRTLSEDHPIMPVLHRSKQPQF
jgi:arachidonate 15-lipoxygenase (second type) / 8-lipoxygenase (S-type)